MNQRDANHAKLIDISNWNDVKDFGAIAASGVVAICMKATEGASWRDPEFPNDYAQTKAHGMDRSAYVFARPGSSSAQATADYFIDYVEANGGFDSLDPMLDLEDAGGLTPNQLADFILQFESRIKERTGRNIILYSYFSFIQSNLSPVASRINHIPLWLADYTSGQIPDLTGFDHWTILQYASDGSVPGIQGNVDLDEFDGSKTELEQTLGSVKVTGGTNMTADQIKQLQTGLKAILQLPASFVIDGVYGPATAAAVKSFQYQAGIKADGQADAVTIAVTSSVKPIDKVMVVTGTDADGLHVRAFPSSSAASRYTLHNGDKIHLGESFTAEGHGWYYTTYGELGGFVWSQYLTDLPAPKPTTPAPAPQPPTQPTQTAPATPANPKRDQAVQLIKQAIDLLNQI